MENLNLVFHFSMYTGLRGLEHAAHVSNSSPVPEMSIRSPAGSEELQGNHYNSQRISQA